MTKNSLTTFNQFVDTIQDAKVKFIDTFVFDDKIRGNLMSFIEAQRTYTKTVGKTATEIAEYSTVAAQNAFETVAKAAK